jgi:hypothetical protein
LSDIGVARPQWSAGTGSSGLRAGCGGTPLGRLRVAGRWHDAEGGEELTADCKDLSASERARVIGFSEKE